jgi:hypothetical protein
LPAADDPFLDNAFPALEHSALLIFAIVVYHAHRR